MPKRNDFHWLLPRIVGVFLYLISALVLLGDRRLDLVINLISESIFLLIGYLIISRIAKDYERKQRIDHAIRGLRWNGQDAHLKIIADLTADGHVHDASLSNQNLSYSNFAGADLKGAKLQGTHFEHAHLVNTIFKEADLRNADFSGAKLSGANFNAADLTNANLFGADLRHARFKSANLTNTNLQGATLTNAIIDEATLNQASMSRDTLLPNGQYWEPPTLRGPRPTK